MIFAQWEDRKVILKAKHDRPENKSILRFDSGSCATDLNRFVSDIRKLIYSKYNIRYADDDTRLISLLWTGQESNVELLSRNCTLHEQEAQHALMRSLWSLIQQEEFLFFRYFSRHEFLPVIHGSCGHVYAVDFAPPTSILHPDAWHIARLTRHRWRSKAKAAIGLLDIIKSTQNDFHEHLHLCDIKGRNFGIASDGSIKAIDTDMVYFKSKLESRLAAKASRCFQHTDCDYFSCSGRCNSTSGRCEQAVTNNNLEVTRPKHCRVLACSNSEHSLPPI